MIKNVESLTDISYVSVFSDPCRVKPEKPDESQRMTRYCRFMEGAVLVMEILVTLSLGLCAYVVR